MANGPPSRARHGQRRDRQGRATQTCRFAAKKGERLIVEVNARRIGSPLDSTIEILDATASRCREPCLRSHREDLRHRSATTTRASPGIRLEAWNELAVDDYLLRRRRSCCASSPCRATRTTTASSTRPAGSGSATSAPRRVHQPGRPMYKVSIHPPGTSSRRTACRCSRSTSATTTAARARQGRALFFDPPADGTYRCGDRRARRRRPDSRLPRHRPPAAAGLLRDFQPDRPKCQRRAARSRSTVNVTRLDGFDGPIGVKLRTAAAGLHAPRNVPSTRQQRPRSPYPRTPRRPTVPARHHGSVRPRGDDRRPGGHARGDGRRAEADRRRRHRDHHAAERGRHLNPVREAKVSVDIERRGKLDRAACRWKCGACRTGFAC